MPDVPRQRWEKRLLDVFGLLVILLMLAIVTQVVLNAIGVSAIARFAQPLPLLGRAITLNSLMELQWHLLMVIALLPAWLVWRRDQHVRVDFLYQSVSERAKGAIELCGHVLFSLPFLILSIPAAWSFAARAWATGETSRDGGLADRFIIKGAIPLGLALLLIVVILDVLPQLRRLGQAR